MGSEPRRRVLLVDDEVSFSRLLKLHLERTNRCDVTVENDGTRALDTARSCRPDIIFLDVVMEKIEGSEVAARIRADADLSRVPIVFLTAVVSREEARAQGGMIGGHPFLAKPVSVHEVLRCIQQYYPDVSVSE